MIPPLGPRAEAALVGALVACGVLVLLALLTGGYP